MMRRSYSDTEKATALAALAANNGDISATSKQLDIPYTTLTRWANGEAIPSHVTQLGEVKKKELAEALEEVAYSLVNAIPGKIPNATLQQVSVSMGIAVEKMRLLRDQSTSISSQELTDEQRLERLRELVERGKRRRLAIFDAHGTAGVQPAVKPQNETLGA